MLNNCYRLAAFLLCVFLVACQTAPVPQAVPAKAVESPQAPAEAEPDEKLSLYDLAITTAREGQTDESIDFFQQLIALDPQFNKAHTNLGLLYFQKKEFESAKAAFLTAIEQDKQDAIAYNHLAIIERQQGQFKASKQHYLQALESDPDYANAHLNLGILLDIYLQDWAGALAHYEKYQALTGSSNETVNKWIIDLQRRIENRTKSKG